MPRPPAPRPSLRGAVALLVLVLGLALGGCVGGEPEAEQTIGADESRWFAQQREALANSLGIVDPPSLEIVRVLDLEEWGTTQVECLREAGFEVGVTEDGEGIDFRAVGDPDLAQSLNLARFTCEAQYPLSMEDDQPLDDARLGELYDYRAGELLACLRDAGYDAGAAPSRTGFIESDGAWSPYDGISVETGRVAGLLAACPQVPAGFCD